MFIQNHGDHLKIAGTKHEITDSVIHVPERRCWLSDDGETVFTEAHSLEFSVPSGQWNGNLRYPTFYNPSTDPRLDRVILGNIIRIYESNMEIPILPAYDIVVHKHKDNNVLIMVNGVGMPLPIGIPVNSQDLQRHRLSMTLEHYLFRCPFCNATHRAAIDMYTWDKDWYRPTLFPESIHNGCLVAVNRGTAYKVVDGKVENRDILKWSKL